ncbi:MAG TPA: MBG domain-containing protein [Planctomycetota bacterium]
MRTTVGCHAPHAGFAIHSTALAWVTWTTASFANVLPNPAAITATVSCTPVTYGSTTAFTLVVTNSSVPPATPTIGSITVAVPDGMLVTGTPTIAAYDAAGTRSPVLWFHDRAGSTAALMRFYTPNAGPNELDVAGHADITFHATATSVGSKTFTATAYTGNDFSNPQFGSQTPSVTVNRAPLTITANSERKTYDAVAYTGGNGVSYSAFVLGEDASVLAGALTFSGSSQGAVDAATYVITPRGYTSANYAVTWASGILTIDAKPVTVTANDKARVYGDANPELDATVVGQVRGGDAVRYSLSTAATQFSSVGDGPFAIAVSLGSNPNYVVTPSNGTLTIEARAVTVTATDLAKTYGDDTPALAATVVGEAPGGDAVNYSLSTTATRFSGVAGHPIVVSLGNNPNYRITPTDGTLTILAKAAAVTATNAAKTYGEDNPALAATVAGEVPGGDAVSYSLSTTATQFSNVTGGPYPITVGLGSNPNYSITSTDGTLTIHAKPVTVTANDTVRIYGDATPALAATVTGQVPGGDAVSYSLSTAATQFSNVAGSPYPIAVSLGSNPNYVVTPIAGTMAIHARPATVTANSLTKAYGDPNPALAATVAGEAAGGDAVSYSLSTTATQFSNVAGSPFAIAVSLGSNPNYAVTPSNGALTISAKAVTVTAHSRVKTYGDANPSLEATVAGGVPGGDAVRYSLSTTATQFSHVAGSPYAIAIGLGANPNYSITPNDGTLVIQARPVTVTAHSRIKTYGDPNPALEATVVGEAHGGDVVRYSLSTAAAQFSSVAGSPYAIAISLGSNPNYSITPNDGTLTIHAKAATVTAHNIVKTYGDANPALEATVVGEVPGGDTLGYSLSTAATQFSNVPGSPYSIEISLAPNPNYRVTRNEGTLTIHAKAATVTANNKVKICGDANPALDAIVVGQVAGGDAVSYTLATTATQSSDAGSSPFAIAVSLGSNPNYHVTPFDGTLTIRPRAATVNASSRAMQ